MRPAFCLLLAGLLLAGAHCTGIQRVEDINLSTADVENFWVAYPAAVRDTAQAPGIFRQQYFDKGSAGLREYYRRKYGGDQGFARRIMRRPRYYATVRPAMLAVVAQRPRILAALRRLQTLYPAVRFNHIYFVVGGFAGSTAQPPGLLIGAEQNTRAPGVDLSELSLVERNRCGTAADTPFLVVHEAIHNNQQSYDGTLLGGATREGMADFIAELVTGSLGTNARLHRYGETHERALWAAFQREMRGPNLGNWLANPAQETPAKPCDLGYYVGYKICQSYYNKAADKTQAVAAMLNARDFRQFLAESGYAGVVATH